MANQNIAAVRSDDKPTFIYGLVDPRTHQLRYIGKTVLTPEKRLTVHNWRARKHPHKRHSMAWLVGLEKAGYVAEIVVIEEVAAGQDWVEAEQFWIAYFRMVGANLCNHTDGGEGRLGRTRSPAEIEKLKTSLPRGEKHYRYGKSMPPHVAAALAEGSRKMRADPVRNARARLARIAGMTSEAMAPVVAGLRRAMLDPLFRANLIAKRSAAAKTDAGRQRVAVQSSRLWATKRAEIIAAQNAGKGEEWRRKQSESKKALWRSPGNQMAAAMKARRRLSDEDVQEIRKLLAEDCEQKAIAMRYGIDPSLVSHIKAGRKR